MAEDFKEVKEMRRVMISEQVGLKKYLLMIENGALKNCEYRVHYGKEDLCCLRSEPCKYQGKIIPYDEGTIRQCNFQWSRR
jgi:hypothetical protein